jgi:prepilin-type N-terminal cleavage/methylation domain-containing protein
LLHPSKTAFATDPGFTLVELLIVIALVAVIFITFSSFFTNYLILYSDYQQDANNFTELSEQSARVADVLRGLTDIVSESANSITVYAYFSPADTYVSEVSYYLNAAGNQLIASVTPMTANPPIGTPITSEIKDYTIISNFYQPPNTNLFNYFGAGYVPLSLPISDEHSISAIQINLAEPESHNPQGQSLSLTVSLRNRLTTL